MRVTREKAWKFLATRIIEQAGLDIVAGRSAPVGSSSWKAGVDAQAFIQGRESDLFALICTSLRQDPDVARSRMLSPRYDTSGIDMGRVDKWA